jgi:hypothetical protein
MAVTVQIAIFWIDNVCVSCRWIWHLNTENGGSMFLQNVGILLHDYMVPQSRRPQSQILPSSKSIATHTHTHTRARAHARTWNWDMLMNKMIQTMDQHLLIFHYWTIFGLVITFYITFIFIIYIPQFHDAYWQVL